MLNNPGAGICGPYSFSQCIERYHGRYFTNWNPEMALFAYQCCADGYSKMLQAISFSQRELGPLTTDAHVIDHWLSSPDSWSALSILSALWPRDYDPHSEQRVGSGKWKDIREGIINFTQSYWSLETVPEGVLSSFTSYLRLRLEIQQEQIRSIRRNAEVLPTLDDVSTWWDPFDMSVAATSIGLPLALFHSIDSFYNNKTRDMSFTLLAATQRQINFFSDILRPRKQSKKQKRRKTINETTLVDVKETEPGLCITTSSIITPIIVLFQDNHFQAIVKKENE